MSTEFSDSEVLALMEDAGVDLTGRQVGPSQEIDDTKYDEEEVSDVINIRVDQTINNEQPTNSDYDSVNIQLLDKNKSMNLEIVYLVVFSIFFISVSFFVFLPKYVKTGKQKNSCYFIVLTLLFASFFLAEISAIANADIKKRVDKAINDSRIDMVTNIHFARQSPLL